MKAIPFVFLAGLLSNPARATPPGYITVGLEMDEVSLLRLNLLGFMTQYPGERFRTAYPVLSAAFDGNPPFSEGPSPSLSFLYGPARLWLDFTAGCAPCRAASWVLSPLGTIYQFLPGGFGNLHGGGNGGLTGSFYVKSNIDIFPFHDHPWIKAAPGAGVGLRIMQAGVIPAAFDLAAGYVHSLEFDFTGRLLHDPGIHLYISFAGD